MASVWRYSSIPVVEYENVAEHSYWVALYAAMILAEIDSTDTTTLGAVIIESLLHDTGECVTGDVVRTFKYSSEELKKQIGIAEEGLLLRLPAEVRKLFDLSNQINKPFRHYVKTIVKMADFLSLFQYMRREALRGNIEIMPYFNRMMKDIGLMASSPAGEVIYNDKFKSGPFYERLHHEASKIHASCFRHEYSELVEAIVD